MYSFPPEDRESGGLDRMKYKLNCFICQYSLFFSKLLTYFLALSYYEC